MSAPLRVAVDARVVASDVRGIGRYERAVLRRMLARDDLALTLLISERFPWMRRGALAQALGTRRVDVANRVPRNADVAWFPANGTFFESKAPVVVTMHDAVPFRYPNPDHKAREREQQPFLRSVAIASAIIAVSQFGKSEIVSVFRADPARITAIYHGIDARFTPGPAGALPHGLREGAYLLFVGDPHEPRKNFALLHRAYMAAWPDGDGPPIVVAGVERIDAPHTIAAGRLGGDVQNAAIDELVQLYRGALAVVVPSYHETFGFPLLEGLACAAPVIASDASSLREIAGDATVLVKPHDADAWSAALRAIARDPQRIERGVRHARSFTWERSADAHIDLLRSVAS